MLEEMEGHCRHSGPGISLMTLLHKRYINLNFVKKILLYLAITSASMIRKRYLNYLDK